MDPTIQLASVADMAGVLAIVPDSQASASGISSAEPVITVALDEDEMEKTPPSTQQSHKTKEMPVKGISRKRKNNSKNSVDTNTAPLYCDQKENVSGGEDTYIPPDLFQPLPQKLSSDNLRKYATISLILKNRAEAKYYETVTSMLGPIKTAILKFNGVDVEALRKEEGDHAYSSQIPTD